MGSKRKTGPVRRKLFEPHLEYKRETLEAAEQLNPSEVYDWLVTHGYFPESYVLPPVFQVTAHPRRKIFFPLQQSGKKTKYVVPQHDLVTVHFPRTE